MSTPHPDSEDENSVLNDFISTIDTDQLLHAASKLRPGVENRLGERFLGGYNVLFEILFSDGLIWLARCPLPYHCSSQDAADYLLQSYASTLRYIKLHTTIPVPTVYDCRRKSEDGNNIGASYLLMERLPGHPIDMQDVYKWHEGYPQARASAKKVFDQLCHYIMQLASVQFDGIGSLQERPMGSGNFVLDEYLDAGITFPPERGRIYESSTARGPFNTTSEYYSAMLSLNDQYAMIEQDEDYILALQHCRLLEPLLTLTEFDKGPFVINHDDLSSSNILIDDEYNITGIIDFPGTTTTLSSLCVYPSIFQENCASPFTDRGLWLECMLNARPVHGSTLNDPEVRKLLMDGALDRGTFDSVLRYIHAYISVPYLARKYGIVPKLANISPETTVTSQDDAGGA
ncbi:hypothetical protein CVT26_002581 [Gymnopilus dilepis]|uniref:Aminoglycoside phosphotransferase domain-containing protein n=1 Tax=Gymnopilus dilepis TaxID=231916 RepID=A0A409VF40_9AGAR|nr:hypothetical protein CVT26_002581 [Gymnopilus dilepis]